MEKNSSTRKLGAGNLIQISTGKVVEKVVNKTITSTNAEKNSSSKESAHTPTPLPLNSKIKCSVPKQNKFSNRWRFQLDSNIFLLWLLP